MREDTLPPGRSLRPLAWAGGCIGFSLGGFFDGILLHQVLQWHHLLSRVRSPVLEDIRAQILADGLFHALMYVIAAVGLWRLWKARDLLAASGADRRLAGSALLGFGLWHLLDAVLSHWLLGLHRVRDAAEIPLLWDIGWLAVFGLVPLCIGWRLLKALSGGHGSGPGGEGPRSMPANGSVAQPAVRGSAPGVARRGLAAVLLVGGAALASLWPQGDRGGDVMVLFRPGISAADAMGRLAAADARVVWADRSGALWAVRMDDPAQAGRLYGQGAWLVSDSRLRWGCFSWMGAGPSA
ncbi:DUF2243 domain-containing protein [Paracidovorax avenae]|uniref:DUF2243 domain-containing protein n=1 Tax=Paracidovorax avenae TaxID=80867 RepID=UPI000D15533E|nr:DUF2243 domain-containing protein [Paracidovorax avenae]AVS82130.1 DUF2243 domain-containing protein [Paracidovorax avenae]AVT17307.1 DUF2243 domain-containing protein [Paracidovorax avenae]AVT21253.1 DUF2243 domain-containing protein [Paracidovorax avenae]